MHVCLIALTRCTHRRGCLCPLASERACVQKKRYQTELTRDLQDLPQGLLTFAMSFFLIFAICLSNLICVCMITQQHSARNNDMRADRAAG